MSIAEKASDSSVDPTTSGVSRFLGKRQELEVNKLFRALVKIEGSDLHLKVGRPPSVRVRGELRTEVRSTPTKWCGCCCR
jgi:twitching motility protein PilT